MIISWLETLLFFIPVSWFGIVALRRAIKDLRAEIVIPGGIIFGIASYIFLLNLISYIIKPPLSIVITYLLLCVLSIVLGKKIPSQKIDFPKTKALLIWFLNILLWAIFLYLFIAKRVGFGGDVNLYYAIGKTFSRGNFPIMSPWQPDLGVGYHYGGAIFLGAINFFTNLSFDFLHRFSALIMLHSLIQILVYFFRRHNNVFSLALYNLLPLSFLILVGIIMIVSPVFPIKFPEVSNIRDFLTWASALPSVHTSFETWGAPSTLGEIVYILHQFMGLSMFVILLVVSIKYSKNTRIVAWIVIGITLAALALVNESIFLPAIFGSVSMIIYREFLFKTSFRIWLTGAIFIVVTFFMIIFQGGIISDTLLKKDSQLSPSMLIFPKTSDIEGDFRYYLTNQQKSKFFEINENFLPLRYYHLGFLWLYLIGGFFLILYIVRHKDNERTGLIIGLFVSALISTLGYNFIVLTYKVADGNRLMIIAYQFLVLLIVVSILDVLDRLWLEPKKLKFALLFIFALWIIGFSSLQPLGEIYTKRSDGNFFIPKINKISTAQEWMVRNLSIDARILSIDGLSPFSSKPTYLMYEAGFLLPSFNSKYRAYTTETSPEYIDMVYTLNPNLLEDFKISYILIDSEGYGKLPLFRKADINNNNFFNLVYEDKEVITEKVYSVNNDFLISAKKQKGTFDELNEIISSESLIYIEDWKDVNPWNQLRKSVIFALKDKNLRLVWGPGVYLNVLARINWQPPKVTDKYDYLVLYKDTNPKTVCSCKSNLIWQGIGSNVKLWKVL